MICRRCRKEVVRGPLGYWAHTTNPKQFHHYPIPIPNPNPWWAGAVAEMAFVLLAVVFVVGLAGLQP